MVAGDDVSNVGKMSAYSVNPPLQIIVASPNLICRVQERTLLLLTPQQKIRDSWLGLVCSKFG